MDNLYIIKIGGNIIDDEARLSAFLRQFAEVEGQKLLVHGGGKLATRLAEQLQVPQQLVDGRRITDAETLRIVTMVYAGYINKNIVAQLQAAGCNAAGICGADGDAIRAHKRSGTTTDYGFVGDVDAVNVTVLQSLLQTVNTLVIAPITHNGEGQLLNTNADTVAQELATTLSQQYRVSLVYSFEKAGVLRNVDDEASLIPVITPSTYESLKANKVIFAGMLPKLDNAFTALSKGVEKVIIGNAEHLPQLIAGTSGTTLTHDETLH